MGKQLIVRPLGRRILVVALDMLAVMMGAPAAGIATKPGPVSIPVDVPPIIPRQLAAEPKKGVMT